VVDEVSGGAEGTSRRTRALLALALVLAVLAAAGDRWRAEQERTALLRAVDGGEQVVDRSSERLLGLRAYVGPLVGDPEARPAARRWAVDSLREEAASWRPRVRAQREAVLELSVAPWHTDLAAARSAYAERLAAWDALLAGVGRRGGGSGERARDAADRASTALLVAGTDADRVRELLGRGEAGAAARR
jgi:predicted lipoprotein